MRLWGAPTGMPKSARDALTEKLAALRAEREATLGMEDANQGAALRGDAERQIAEITSFLERFPHA
jgi:hypothetical protein